MEPLVIPALLVILLAVAAPAIFTLRRRLAAGSSELGLGRMLERRGLSFDDTLKHPHALAAAVRRCAFCASADDCRKWLASDAREGAEAFCPNAHYLRRLEQR